MFLIIGVFLFLSGVTVAAEDIPYGEIYGKLEERLAGQKEVVIEVSGGGEWLKLTSVKNSIIKNSKIKRTNKEYPPIISNWGMAAAPKNIRSSPCFVLFLYLYIIPSPIKNTIHNTFETDGFPVKMAYMNCS